MKKTIMIITVACILVSFAYAETLNASTSGRVEEIWPDLNFDGSDLQIKSRDVNQQIGYTMFNKTGIGTVTNATINFNFKTLLNAIATVDHEIDYTNDTSNFDTTTITFNNRATQLPGTWGSLFDQDITYFNGYSDGDTFTLDFTDEFNTINDTFVIRLSHNPPNLDATDRTVWFYSSPISYINYTLASGPELSISPDYPSQGQTLYGNYTQEINITLNNVNGTVNCNINNTDWINQSNDNITFSFINTNNWIYDTSITVQINCTDNSQTKELNLTFYQAESNLNISVAYNNTYQSLYGFTYTFSNLYNGTTTDHNVTDTVLSGKTYNITISGMIGYNNQTVEITKSHTNTSLQFNITGAPNIPINFTFPYTTTYLTQHISDATYTNMTWLVDGTCLTISGTGTTNDGTHCCANPSLTNMTIASYYPVTLQTTLVRNDTNTSTGNPFQGSVDGMNYYINPFIHTFNLPKVCYDTYEFHLTDLNYYVADYLENITINYTTPYIWATSEANKLVINFSQATEGLIVDSDATTQRTRAFNDSQIVLVHQDLVEGKVTVKFNCDWVTSYFPNGSNDTLLTDCLQEYSYINENSPESTIMHLDLMTMNNITDVIWFKTMDYGTSPIQNVQVRLYAMYVEQDEYSYENGQLVSGTTTDSQGYTKFFVDPDAQYTATFVKDGYNTQTYNFDGSEIVETTQATAKEIRLVEESIFDNNIGNTGLPNLVRDNTYIYGAVYIPDVTDSVTYTTDYRINQSYPENGLTERGGDIYEITLSPNTDFDFTSDTSVTIYIYKDSELEFTHTITYDPLSGTDIMPAATIGAIYTLAPIGLSIVLATLLIALASFIGTKVDDERAGYSVFIAGSVILVIFTPKLLWVGMIGVLYYVLRYAYHLIDTER